jgi:hypothetical protein
MSQRSAVPPASTIDAEIDRQLDVLVAKGYPTLAGLGEPEFRALADHVRTAAAGVVPAAPSEQRVPFLLVTTRDVVPAESALPLTSLAGKDRPGVVDRNHGEGDLAGYHPIESVTLPGGRLYALVDVERGEEFCDVRPQDALPVVLGRGRTPLTIDEGVALVTQFPQVLQKNKCFMLSGSRRHDKRVPALWIGQGAPKLGWCWDGNPHSWLGTASVGARLG